jgi:hypothetical protein
MSRGNSPPDRTEHHVITKILHTSVAIAQQVVGGIARAGLEAIGAVARKISQDTDDHPKPGPEGFSAPTVSTEPVQQPPSPAPRPRKTTPRKTTPRKTTPRKPTPKGDG